MAEKTAATEQFSIREFPDRGICCLSVDGDLSFDGRKDFSRFFGNLLASPREKLVIDMTRLERIVSVYLGTLVDCHKRATERNKTLTVLIPPKLQQTFKVFGIDKAVQIIAIEPKPEASQTSAVISKIG